MKICFITNNIAEKGGVQRVLSVVANGLSKGNDVSILMTSPRAVSEQICFPISDSVTIMRDNRISKARNRYPLHKIAGYINKKFIRFQNSDFLQKIFFPAGEMEAYDDFFKNNRFDAIIGVQPRAAGVVSLLQTDSVKIGWMHNTYDAYFHSPQMYQWRQDYLYKNLFGKLHKMIVLTDQDKNNYIQKKIAGDTDVVRIYNPLSFISGRKSPLNSGRLLFVGRLQYEQKGLDLLVDIVKKIKRIHPDIVVDVVGDGPGRERLISAARDADVLFNLNLIGMVDDVQEYYKKSDLFLLTSRNEGFGLVVTEAMECGVPVVSFSTEGPSEIIQDGINGFLVERFDTDDFANKVLFLCDNDEVRERLGKNARKRAADFSEAVIIRQWNELLNHAV